MIEPKKSTNLLKREPVLIGAFVVYLLADLLTGTGTNSTLGAGLAGVSAAALRFIVTSPATAEQKDAIINRLRQRLDSLE